MILKLIFSALLLYLFFVIGFHEGAESLKEREKTKAEADYILMLQIISMVAVFGLLSKIWGLI